MFKFIKNLTIVLVIFMLCCVIPALFIGCASNKVISSSGKIDMPDWYLVEESSKDGIYSVGSAKMVDIQISLKMAEADAMNNASKRISVIIKDVTQTMISGSKTAYMKGFEENALQTSIATVADARRTATYIAKDGTVYMQIFIPYKTEIDKLNRLAKDDYKLSDEYLATQEKMENAYNKYFSNN